MITIADLHLREESEDVIFNEVFPGIRAALKDDPDKVLAILGDVWHIRYRVNVRLQNRVTDFFETLALVDGAWTVLLPGNHDQINVEGENALEIFSRVQNVLVYTEPMWNNHGLWIPYRKNPEDIAKALTIPRPKNIPNSPPILWMHHGIQGLKMNNNRVDDEGLPISMFQNFEHVYCGHYHGPQTLKNVTYIGSPYQTRADEAGQVKRYGIWHRDSRIMNYKNVEWGKKYHHIRVTPDSPLVMASDVKLDDEFRIQVTDGVDAEELGRIITDQGFKNVVITQEQAAAEARLDVAPQGTLTDYAQAYVNQFSGNMDVERLMKVFTELTQ